MDCPITIEAAADLCCCGVNTIAALATRGEIPACKVGTRWVFLQEDVLAYVRQQIDEQTAQRRDPGLHLVEATRVTRRGQNL